MSPTTRALPNSQSGDAFPVHAETAATDADAQWTEHAAPAVEDGAADFHIGIGAEAGAPPGVLLTYAHVRWLFEPERAEALAAGLVEAARRARAAAPQPLEPGVRA